MTEVELPKWAQQLFKPSRFKAMWGQLTKCGFKAISGGMRKILDYSGRRYGRLVILGVAEARPGGDHLCDVQCDCGARAQKRVKAMRDGHTRSCGCLFVETMRQRNETHGLSRKHPGTYRSWKDMRRRCLAKTSTDYANYGGRGISIIPAWDSFAQFVADMGTRPEAKTLDRINSEGNYEPSNCRWADAEVQANNQRRVRLYEMGGHSLSLAQWAKRFGMERKTLAYRLGVGLDLREALTSGDLRKH